MAYNPYAAMGFPAKTPEQLAQEYNSLLTNYQNVYRNMQPMAAVTPQTPNVNAIPITVQVTAGMVVTSAKLIIVKLA